ncbi:MAG: hypothetical protein LUE86_01750 [Clostridiales bacterium]|nr:hypothetical protein [Clostridiales bacterium]
MSSKTKIVVLRMKEIIYTAVFLGFAVLLILLLFIMFRPGSRQADTPAASSRALYVPGVYSSALQLGSQEVNIEVTVDSDRITSIQMTSLSDSVAAMYPLAAPSLQRLAEQILASQSLENLSYADETRYTSQFLVSAIERAVGKARVRD